MPATKSKGKSSREKYDNTNRGVLFVNDKGDNENRPDFTGTLTINMADFETDDEGMVTVRLAGWNRNSETAGDYLSLAASPPRR